MRFSIDTNILFYSFDADDARHGTAKRLLLAALLADCVVTNQVLGEFLNATRRRHVSRADQARAAVGNWAIAFALAPTALSHLLEASVLAERHRLQFWDSVILVVAAAAGAEWLLTEDMQDGATLHGVRLLNPFNPANAELLDLLLTPVP